MLWARKGGDLPMLGLQCQAARQGALRCGGRLAGITPGQYPG